MNFIPLLIHANFYNRNKIREFYFQLSSARLLVGAKIFMPAKTICMIAKIKN